MFEVATLVVADFVWFHLKFAKESFVALEESTACHPQYGHHSNTYIYIYIHILFFMVLFIFQYSICFIILPCSNVKTLNNLITIFFISRI